MPRKRTTPPQGFLPNKRGKFTPNRHRIEGNTAYIELTDRRDSTSASATVSVEDLPRVLAAGRWNCNRRRKGLAYCGRSYRIEGRACVQWLHRFIMGEPAGVCDHINGNGLDNRRENLRVVTAGENQRNRHRTSAKSGVVGVHWDRRYHPDGPWFVDIGPKGPGRKRHHFPTVEEASTFLKSVKATK
jgi:HNH endonuclease